MQNLVGKRRTKVEKMEMKIFIFLAKKSQSLENLITNISIFSDHENTFLEGFLFEKMNNKSLIFTLRQISYT